MSRRPPAGQAPAALPTDTSTAAQYADQQRGVIDQSERTPYTTDASYAIGAIPQDTPPLIPGQDVELVRTNCSVCHATTFISSQPPLPGSTWHDEVYKMKERYGATFISDENANKIIAYLSAHYTPDIDAVRFPYRRNSIACPSREQRGRSAMPSMKLW